MDKKKKITGIKVLVISLLLGWAFPALAQEVNTIRLGDKQYEYGVGNDSIKLFLKVLDSDGKRCNNVYADDLREHFGLVEDEDTIPKENGR